MAAFASCRRSGCVRFLVVLLCALFVFSTLGAPAARAEALTVGLFTAAAVLSAATAALGFKLSNSADGQATLAKMVQDFKSVAWATGFVLVGSKINGLIDGVDYIKMQVKAGKTYLDERVVAWVQQWLADSGVYNTSGISIDYSDLDNFKSGTISVSSLFTSATLSDVIAAAAATGKFSDDAISKFNSLASKYNLYNSSDYVGFCVSYYARRSIAYIACYPKSCFATWSESDGYWGIDHVERDDYPENKFGYYDYCSTYDDKFYKGVYTTGFDRLYPGLAKYAGDWYFYGLGSYTISSNNTGLSGTDTIGKDVVDKSLDEVLAGLKEWAPDWWDAGADSSTNSATGAKDLPLNMGSDVKTVTGNPVVEVDQPLIYTPWFEETLENLRNGETAGTVTNSATSAADTADKAEAAQGTVEDAQGVVQSIINWGLDYISPDKGLFSRFPLCIPYDAYLLVTAALGVDAQDLGDIVGQSPGELSAQIDDGVAVQSDFVPVISVKHDWTQDGVTTPVEVTIDLRPYDGVIKMIRTLVSVYVIAELIASEYKRIRGS